jgi:hypothetical protein
MVAFAKRQRLPSLEWRKVQRRQPLMRWLRLFNAFFVVLFCCDGSSVATRDLYLPRGDTMKRGGGAGGGVTLTSLAITPDPLTVDVGTPEQITVTGTYSDSSTLNLTSAVTLTSDDEGVATVSEGSAGGIVAGVSNGTATITATLGSVSDTVDVTSVQSSNLVSLTLGTTNGTATTATPITQAIPLWIPDDVTSVKVYLANRVKASNATVGAINGVDLAVGVFDGLDDYLGAPSKVTNITIPGDGTFYASPDLVVGSRVAGKQILVAWTIPNGSTIAVSLTGSSWGLRSVSTASVDPLPSDFNTNQSLAFDVRVEFTTDIQKRVVISGDSLTIGYDPSVTMRINPNSWWYKASVDGNYQFIVDGCGVSASKMSEWNQSGVAEANSYLSERMQLTGAIAVIALGTNDLGGGLTLAQFQSLFLQRKQDFIDAGASFVGALTIAPSIQFQAFDSVRAQVNSWLLANEGVLFDFIVDASGILEDPSDPDQLDPSYDIDSEAGRVHWNIAANAAVAAEFVTKIGAL